MTTNTDYSNQLIATYKNHKEVPDKYKANSGPVRKRITDTVLIEHAGETHVYWVSGPEKASEVAEWHCATYGGQDAVLMAGDGYYIEYLNEDGVWEY
jgi:hypothetical protein